MHEPVMSGIQKSSESLPVFPNGSVALSRLFCSALVLLLIPLTAVWAQTSQPHMSNPTLAKVGDERITQSMIDQELERYPANLSLEERRELQTMILRMRMFKILAKEYFKANNVQFTQNDLAEVHRQQEGMTRKNPNVRQPKLKKEELENWARYIHLQKETASPEKINALIQEHPDYFNGTKVCASHILIPCSPLASTKEQNIAKNKIKRIQADLRAGQITFAEAARAYSACPSKSKGGNLGEFSFSDMVAPFARAAFDAKSGDVTDIVRTEYGFHLIHVTGRSEGTETPDPDKATALVNRLLQAELQNRIIDQALTTVSIELFKLPVPAPIATKQNDAATKPANKE